MRGKRAVEREVLILLLSDEKGRKKSDNQKKIAGIEQEALTACEYCFGADKIKV